MLCGRLRVCVNVCVCGGVYVFLYGVCVVVVMGGAGVYGVWLYVCVGGVWVFVCGGVCDCGVYVWVVCGCMCLYGWCVGVCVDACVCVVCGCLCV